MLFQKPLEVKIELTRGCNYSCSFCFNRNRQHAPGLSEEDVKRIIEGVADAGIKKIRFTGGEPLLREDLLPILSFAKEQGLNVMLNTNASLIDEANAQRLAPVVDDFLISMHAFDSAAERKLAGKDFFEKKIKAIQLLADQNSFIRAATILSKQNIRCLEKGHKLVSSLPFSQWVLLRPMPIAENKRPIDNRDIGLAVEKLLKINSNRKEEERYFIENALPFCSYEPEKVKQVALGAIHEDGHSSLVVDCSGTIKPSYFSGQHLGNALQDSFLECWQSPFMQRLHSLDFSPGACKQCKHLMLCLSGSRASALIVNNSLNALDPLALPERYKRQLIEA